MMKRWAVAGLPGSGTPLPAILAPPSSAANSRDRLIAVGATPVGEITENAAGDRFAMLRDPWGLALQLAQRARPLVG